MHESPTCRGAGARRSPAAFWLLGVLVLALALLNPLACLVHCLPRPEAANAMLGGITAVCHIPPTTQADVPANGAALTGGQAATPQAAFAFIAPLLVVLLLGSYRAATVRFAWTASPQVFVRPLAPPPR